jgi:hypothetical protein
LNRMRIRNRMKMNSGFDSLFCLKKAYSYLLTLFIFIFILLLILARIHALACHWGLGLSKKTYFEENNLCYTLFFYHRRKKMHRKSPSGFFAKKLIFLIVASERSRQLFLPQRHGGRKVAQRG